MSQHEKFTCDVCNVGIVEFRTGPNFRTSPNRSRLARFDLELAIPDDHLVMTCDRCNEIYLSLEESRELDYIQGISPIPEGWMHEHLLSRSRS